MKWAVRIQTFFTRERKRRYPFHYLCAQPHELQGDGSTCVGADFSIPPPSGICILLAVLDGEGSSSYVEHARSDAPDQQQPGKLSRIVQFGNICAYE